jgi:hypothetical protein
MDSSSRHRNILNAVSESNLLRLQVEQPELWTRMLVGDLVKEKMNLLQCARQIRTGLQETSINFTICSGRKRKAPSSLVCSPTPSIGLSLSSPPDLDLSPPKPFDAKSTSILGLSLSPSDFNLQELKPTKLSNEEDETNMERRLLSAPMTPAKHSKGKENNCNLRIDTTFSEDDFAAQQLVQLQLTPPSMPRRHLHKDPRSLSPTGQHDLLALLAKTCCQEKPSTISFFSFDSDEACELSYSKRPKIVSGPGKFDSLLHAVNNVSRAEMKTPVPKSKSKTRRKNCASKKRRKCRVH